MSFLPSYRAGSPGPWGALDVDVVAWAAAVAVNGGSVSSGRTALLSGLVSGLKAAGSWQLTDDYWLLVAENAIQALTSLKQKRLGTAVNSPAFTADRGYAFDGATNYIDTGFIPSSHAANMTATVARLAAYDRANVSSNGSVAGIIQSTGRSLRLVTRTAGGTTAILDCQSSTGTYTNSDSRGLFAASRNGGTDATTVSAYRNGAVLTRTIDPTSFATILPTTAFFIGGQNAAGSLNAPRATTVGMVSIGGVLTAAQELGSYTLWQAHMTALGAGV
jgi:hypothetical protein